MSIIFTVLVVIGLFFSSPKLSLANCVPNTRICYDANTVAWCNSDGTGYELRLGYNSCEYGCSGGNCLWIDNAIPGGTDMSQPSCECSYDGETVTGNNTCFKDSDHESLKCICREQQFFESIFYDTYIVVANDCCPAGKTAARSGYGCEVGCRGVNSNEFVGVSNTTKLDSSYCLYTSHEDCFGYVTKGSSSAFVSDNCTFDSTSGCYCRPNTGWDIVGSGCHPVNSSCASGWTSNYTEGEIAQMQCAPCGNNPKTCYKIEPDSIACYNDSQCSTIDPCNICYNDGTVSSYCGTKQTDGVCGSTTNSCNTGCVVGTGAGAEKCVDLGGVCQYNSSANGTACTLNNGVAGKINSAAYCMDQYYYGYQCCVPNSGTAAVPVALDDNAWTCRGAAGGSNAECKICPAAESCPKGCSTTSVLVEDGNCGKKTCAANCTTNCASGSCDVKPSFSMFDIQNVNGTSLNPVLGGQYHICDSIFTKTASPTTARFVVTYLDQQGGSDIGNIQLEIAGKYFTDSILTLNGKMAIAIFDVPRSAIPSTNLEEISVRAVDKHAGLISNWQVVPFKFKYWDCNVAVTGTGYDGSSTGALCSNSNSFLKKISIDYDLLIMKNVSSGSNKSMTVNSPSYSSGSNPLVWGQSYIFHLENFDGAEPSQLKFNGNNCDNLEFTVDESIADPFASSVGFTADFSSVLNQDPWWQVVGGGVVSNTKINDRVPVTCVDNCVISNNGLVIAPSVDNTGKSFNNIQPWSYSSTTSKLVDVNKNYSYLFNQYFVKNGIGTTLAGKTISSVSDLGSDANNIYFVNGDLVVDGNIDNGNNFLMMIVSGNVTVNTNVNKIDGILVAKNIGVAGTSPEQMVFNGSLFASENINFSRGYDSKVINNTTPAVVVNYNPALMFNLPNKITKALINWQW